MVCVLLPRLAVGRVGVKNDFTRTTISLSVLESLAMKIIKLALVAVAVVSLSACGFDLSSGCQIICF
jgi:hypothetical protein